MFALVPVNQFKTELGSESTVNARDLHRFLEVDTGYSYWIQNRIDQFGFMDGCDFFIDFCDVEDGGDGKSHYHLSLDMAKKVSTLERSAKSKQARLYFIECEKQALDEEISSITRMQESLCRTLRNALSSYDDLVQEGLEAAAV